MEQKILKRTYDYTIYIATDGTEFDDKDECKKYEESAKCAVNMRYKKLVIAEYKEDEISPMGCDENIVELIDLKSEKDVDTVLQRYALEYSKEQVERWGKKVRVGKCLIGRGYEYDNFWIVGMVEDLVERLTNL